MDVPFNVLLILLINIGFAPCAVTGNRQCSKDNSALNKGLSTLENNFVNDFRGAIENKQSDLIILLDRSNGMRGLFPFNGRWTSCYFIVKHFIEALLSNVRISFNTTRIAVVTYASTYSRDINYIWNPTTDKNKCRFKQEFKNIKNPGGATNIKDALQDAYNIFAEVEKYRRKHRYRPKSNKVVLLIADNYGNVYDGPNPGKPSDASYEANQLRNTNCSVFTVGIGHWSKDRMRSWASRPSAFLDVTNIERITQIVKIIQATRNYSADVCGNDDDDVFSNVDGKVCGTCSPNADCSCHLLKGMYSCVCRRGFYGTGDQNDGCKVCPADTYGEQRGYVKREDCRKCPENSETRSKPNELALSVADCGYCKLGFSGNPAIGVNCSAIPCGPYLKIKNATPMNERICLNAVFGQQCEYKCDHGYKMINPSEHTVKCIATEMNGTPIGHWSSPIPECKIIVKNESWWSTISFIGGIIGGVVVLIFVPILIFVFLRRRKRKCKRDKAKKEPEELGQHCTHNYQELETFHNANTTYTSLQQIQKPSHYEI